MTNDKFIKIDPIQDMVRQDRILFTEAAIILKNIRTINMGPRCLIYGYTAQKRPLRDLYFIPPHVRVVTVHQPDPDEWIDNRTRRKP